MDTNIAQAFHAVASTLDQLADIVRTLALARNDSEPLGAKEVAEAIRVSDSKARQILRAYGEGRGKLRRIARGDLIRLHMEGKLNGNLDKALYPDPFNDSIRSSG